MDIDPGVRELIAARQAARADGAKGDGRVIDQQLADLGYQPERVDALIAEGVLDEEADTKDESKTKKAAK